MSSVLTSIVRLIKGYPMTLVESRGYKSLASGCDVGLYRDKYGRTFLADGPNAKHKIPFKTFLYRS